MDIHNNQTAQNESRLGPAYCSTIFNVAGAEAVNHYKCDQQPISASDLYRINRNKKEVRIRTGIY